MKMSNIYFLAFLSCMVITWVFMYQGKDPVDALIFTVFMAVLQELHEIKELNGE